MLQDQDVQNPRITEESDEISLLDLFAVLIKRKWMIIIITLIAAAGVVVFSIISLKLDPEKSFLPNKYKVEAHMLIANDKNGSNASLSGSASSLSSLLGMSLASKSSSTSNLVIYLASSNPFLDAVAEEFDLLEKLPPNTKSPVATVRKDLKEVILTSYDSGSGVLTISMEEIDPEYSCEVINFTVDWISQKLDELGVDNNKITKENLEKNIDTSWSEITRLTKELAENSSGQIWNPNIGIEKKRLELELSAQQQVYTSLRSQLELLKVQMQTETPNFQILERPSVPDIKSGPSRGKLCIIVVFAAFFVSIFLAFLLNAIENIRKDPVAMKKLHPGKNQKTE